MKCLIADDDPRLRRMLMAVLEAAGLEFLEAQNGAEAVELFRAHQPELVIMDVEMGAMDGITATRLIRTENARSRIFILSQHDSPQFRQAADAVGAVAYVLKDDLQDILEVIDRHIHLPG